MEALNSQNLAVVINKSPVPNQDLMTELNLEFIGIPKINTLSTRCRSAARRGAGSRAREKSF